MIFYIIIVILILIGLYFERKWCCILSTLVLLLFAGLRANNVGTDTIQYLLMYDDIQSYSSLNQMLIARSSHDKAAEVGYYILEYICHFFMNYNMFKVICASLTILPVGYIIKKYSEHPTISFLIFYMLPIYTLLSMTAMRQGIAFGFFLLAVDACFERRLKMYLGWMIAGALIHNSVLFFIPIYFLNYIDYYRLYNKYIFLLLVLVAIMNSSIFLFLNSYSRLDYAESVAEASGTTRGEGMLIFLILYFITSYLVNERFLNKDINKYLIYFIAVTIACWLVGLQLAAILRLAAYTEFFLALYVSNTLFKITDKSTRNCVIGLILIGTFFIMNRIVVRESTNEYNWYYPYYFNWEY